MIALPLLSILSAVLVTGTVRDPSGAGISGASVYIRGTDIFCVSAADGRFELAGTASGGATLVAAHAGFRATERHIILTDSPLTIDLTLEIEPHAERVDVAAASVSPPPSSAAPLQLDPLDIYRTPGTDGDLMRAVQMMPGVSKVDEGAGLYVRGGDVSETATYLDHAFLYHPYRYETPTGGFFGAVDPYLISGLSLSTGAFPARYGDALSGVLELTGLGPPPRESLYANLGLGTASASLALPLGEHIAVRFSANQSLSRLLFDLNPTDQHFSKLPSSTDLNLSLYADAGSFGRFKFSAFTDQEQVGVETQQNAFTGILNSSSRNRLFSLGWQKKFHDWLLEVTASLAAFHESAALGVLDLASSDSGQRLRLDLSRRLAQWTFRAGADLERHRALSNGVTPIHGGDLAGLEGTRPLTVDQDAWRSAAYFEAERVLGRFRLNAGVRSDRFQALRALTVDPRASITYSLTARQRLRAAWGLYHQAPSPEYLNTAYGNPRLPPMRAAHYGRL